MFNWQVEGTSVGAGPSVTVAVTNGPGNPKDWLALYVTDTADSAHLDWFFLNGTKSAPASGLTTASVTFAMPMLPGNYEVRFFSNNTFRRLGTSPTVTVAPPATTVTVNSSSVAITVTAGANDSSTRVKNATLRVRTRAGTPMAAGSYRDRITGRAPFSIIKKLVDYVRNALALPHLLMFQISPARSLVESDVERYIQEYRYAELADRPKWQRFLRITHLHPDFRTVLYLRVEAQQHWPSYVILKIAKLFYPGSRGLWIICPEIGPGLFIEHGFCTMVSAKSIGANCWINQQVTIGHLTADEGPPVIGNNVRIAAGAQLLGNITIGDNCVIGPNSFVHKSVPPNCTVVGVPAYIIRRNGKMVRPRGGRRKISSAAQ
jgi:serine O-acetyltransferase